MSNDPDYTWHLRNLNNFVNLSPRWPVSHATPRPAAAFRRAQPPLCTRESAGVQPHACARQPARLRHAEDRNRNRNAAVIVGATLHVATSRVARCTFPRLTARVGRRVFVRLCVCGVPLPQDRNAAAMVGSEIGSVPQAVGHGAPPSLGNATCSRSCNAARNAQQTTDDTQWRARERCDLVSRAAVRQTGTAQDRCEPAWHACRLQPAQQVRT